MPRSWIIVPLLLLILTACEHDIYTVRMAASDEGFERELRIVRQESNDGIKLPPQEVLDPVIAIYGSDGQVAPAHFAAVFSEATPTDVGGWGRLERIESSLGTTFVYLERFRGDNNPSERVDRVQDAASVLAETFADWLDHMLAGEQLYESVAADMRERLEHDARQLSMLLWLNKNAHKRLNHDPKAEGEGDLTAAIAIYLFEHGYISADLLATAGVSLESDGDLDRLLVAWLTRELHAAPDNPPASLQTIFASTSLEESWNTFFENSEPTTQRLRNWAHRAGVEATESDDLELVTLAFTIATGFELVAEDRVDLYLACPVEPIDTNGTWSEEDREISWNFTIEPSKDTPYLVPAVAFATWAEPNKASQTELLGGMKLEGEKLAEYCVWRGRLSENEGKRWDTFLASLDGTNPAEKLESYEPDQDPAWNAEPTGRSILLEALTE